MELYVKKFDELTTTELYEIMRLRVKVFVVEQNCPYQDLDDRDFDAYHVFLRDEEGIEAYLRVTERDENHEDVMIGRVIAVKRRCGLGTRIVKAGIATAGDKLRAEKIVVEAQTYAKGLYEKCGFVRTSDEFLEDGIPHVRMEKTLSE